jgi:hypothetical protein
VIAQDLTREADAGHAFGGEDGALGFGHGRGFPVDELDTAGRAAGVAAARVQLIDLRILLEGQDEALALFHVNGPKPFNGQFRHTA